MTMTKNKSQLFKQFIEWVEKNIDNGNLSINQSDSFLHVVNEGLLVLPVILTDFLNNHADSCHINNEESLKSIIMSSIFSLTSHKSLVWKYDVVSNRLYNSFQVEGLLIRDFDSILTLQKTMPMRNEYLFLEVRR